MTGEQVYERMKSKGAASWADLSPDIQRFWERVAQAQSAKDLLSPALGGRHETT